MSKARHELSVGPIFNNILLATKVLQFSQIYGLIRKKPKGHKNPSCSSKVAKLLWFDVRVNEICVKFSFTGSEFGKSNYSMFHYSLRIIDELKMSEIRI